MKILGLVDFSPLSANAAEYAAGLAENRDAELVLLHVIFVEGFPRAEMLNSRQLEKAMEERTEQEGARLMKQLAQSHKGNVNMKFGFHHGYPLEKEVENYAVRHGFDLVVMGTKGATGLKKVLMGTGATAVIGHSSIPVLAVPEHARFRQPRHIVYASDFSDVRNEAAKLIELLGAFHATLDILHVGASHLQQPPDVVQLQEQLRSELNYSKLNVDVLPQGDLVESIDGYLEKTGADLLAMFTHEHDFLDVLFGERVVREMAFHSRVPLLSIKK
jgi:nucleotide-binding universal stress UspA family protein